MSTTPLLSIYVQGLNFSAGPRNSAVFRDFWVILDISVNLVRNYEASPEPLGLQKSFTYQNLQDFVEKIAGLFSKQFLQKLS